VKRFVDDESREAGADILSFRYDPFGRRIQKSYTTGANPPTTTTTNYLYDGDNGIEEVDPNGNVLARYSQGLNIDEPLAMLRGGATSFYHADGLGSVTSLSNSAGTLAQTYTFDSFGKQTASSGSLTNPFRYTAREFDSETNLYFYRARYYDQSTGRFLNEDPIRFRGGINFYRYVGNNATNYTDPDGNGVVDCLQAIADLAAATANVAGRTVAIIPYGKPDFNHQKSLQQAVNQLNKALDKVQDTLRVLWSVGCCGRSGNCSGGSRARSRSPVSI